MMSKLYPKLQIGGNTPSRQGNTIDDYVFNPLIKKAEEAKNWAIKKATPVVSNIVAKMLPSTTPQFIRNHIYNSYDTVKYPDIATAFSQYGFGNRDLKKHEIEKGVVHVGEEAWKKFLDLPQDSKWIQPSPDKPDSSVNKSSKFYQLSPQVVDSNYVVNYARSQNKPVGTIVGMNGLSPFVPKSHMSEENFNAIDPLQHFNMEYGKDTKGRYVAIHDKYDFDNKVVDKIGKPFEFYKRYHYQQGGTLSQLGYKRHSPYNKAPSLLINTPTGSITMKEVDHPILGIGHNEIKFMLPNKEYQFKSNKVLEIPMRSVYPKAQMGMRLPSDNTKVVRNFELPQKFNQQGLKTNLVGDRTGNEIKKDFGKTGTGEVEESISPLDVAQMGVAGVKLATKIPSLISKIGSKVAPNAYKLNPLALKENPNMFLYRTQPKGFVAGYTEKQMLEDLIANKTLKGEKIPFYVTTKYNRLKHEVDPFTEVIDEYHGKWFDKNPNRMPFYINGRLDGDEGDILRLNVSKNEASTYNLKNFPIAQKVSYDYDTEFILPSNKIKQSEIFSTNYLPQLIKEDKMFNTPHWIKGFKKVDNSIYPKKYQQGGQAPEMSQEQQQEIVRRVRNLRKKLPKMGVAYDPISFRHAMYVNKKAFDQQDQELLSAFDEEMMVKLMNEVPDDDQPTYKKGGSIKGKSKMYPKCKCGCGGVSVGKVKTFEIGGTMDVLDGDGNSQMKIEGGERIFSRVATKKMLELNESKNYAELGKYICDELKAQDEREPQYVKE